MAKKSTNANHQKKTLVQRSLDAAFKGGSAGFLAMALQVVLFMWLRTVVNYQYAHEGVTLREAVSELYEQGGVARFYQGVWIALVMAPLVRFGDTAANQGIQMLLAGDDTKDDPKQIPLFVVTFLGSLAASGWRMFLTPLDNFKTNLQVHGRLDGLITKITAGPMGFLHMWDGAVGSMLAGIVGHYPWFAVNNWLESWVPPVSDGTKKNVRRALIGLACSITSDTVSNFLRVIKTVKQTSDSSAGYWSVAYTILQESGWIGLFTRGLKTKMLVNTLQSMVFALLWKSIMEYLHQKDKKEQESSPSRPSPKANVRKPTSSSSSFSHLTRSRYLQALVGGSVFCCVLASGRQLRGAMGAQNAAEEIQNQRDLPELDQPRIALIMSVKRKCPKGKCSFENYGDQLMYHTALQQCAKLGADCRLAPDGPYSRSRFLQQFAKDFQPHAVWYALGYAYGDKFQSTRMGASHDQIKFWRQNGVQHIALMPQAVGPFTKKPERSRAFFSEFDYRAVREQPSYQALKGLDNDFEVHHIQDTVLSRRMQENEPVTFTTNTTQCLPTPKQQKGRPLIGISLSNKMFTEIGAKDYHKEVSEILPLLAKNATLVLIPHEQKKKGDDDVHRIRQYYNKAITELGVDKDHIFACDLMPSEVYTMERIIAGMDLLVVMRYHTMVVALREGIPTAAYSWAPKYQELLKASGIGEGALLSFGNAPDSVRRIWDTYHQRADIVPKIREFMDKTRPTIDNMFATLVAEASKKKHPNSGDGKEEEEVAVTRELTQENGGTVAETVVVGEQPPPAEEEEEKDTEVQQAMAVAVGEEVAVVPDDNKAVSSTTAVAVVQDNSAAWRTKTTCFELGDDPDSGIPEPLLSRGRCRGSLASVPNFGRGKKFSTFEKLSRQHGTTGHPKDVQEVTSIKNYDAARFSKYVANEKKAFPDLSHDNLVALVLKYQHQVEKGLAMPPEKQRLHFGVGSGVFSKLSKFGGEYIKRYGAKQSLFIFEGLGATIDQYVNLHESKGETVAKAVTNLRQLLTTNGVEWKEKDGGIGSVSKETYTEFAQKDFESLVYARRSIRQYAPRLDDQSEEYAAFRSEVYDAIRLAAEGTPSVCNRQGVKVALIRDKGTIAKASQIQGGSKGHDDPEYMLMVQTNLQIFRESRERNQAYVDGGLFAMSLMYALQSKGLATCSLNFSASEQKDQAMRKLLNVDDSHVIVMFLAVGRLRDDVVYTVSPRRSSHDIQAIVREI